MARRGLIHGSMRLAPALAASLIWLLFTAGGAAAAGEISSERATEDFERGIENSDIFWVCGGDGLSFGPWEKTTDRIFSGHAAARSGLVSTPGKSWIQTVWDVSEAGQIDFWFLLPAHGGLLQFLIDCRVVAEWSGSSFWATSGWCNATFDVTPGLHVFRWVFTMVGSPSGDRKIDCVYLDEIRFPPGWWAISLEAVVKELKGDVEIFDVEEKKWLPAAVGLRLPPNATISTGLCSEILLEWRVPVVTCVAEGVPCQEDGEVIQLHLGELHVVKIEELVKAKGTRWPGIRFGLEVARHLCSLDLSRKIKVSLSSLKVVTASATASTSNYITACWEDRSLDALARFVVDENGFTTVEVMEGCMEVCSLMGGCSVLKGPTRSPADLRPGESPYVTRAVVTPVGVGEPTTVRVSLDKWPLARSAVGSAGVPWQRAGEGRQDIGFRATDVCESTAGDFIVLLRHRELGSKVLRLDPTGKEVLQEFDFVGRLGACLSKAHEGGWVVAGTQQQGIPIVWSISDNGLIQWDRAFHSELSALNAILPTRDGGYILAGQGIDRPAEPQGVLEACLVKIDRWGQVLWRQTYPGLYNISSLTPTRDGGYAMVGSTSPDPQLCDGFLLKTDGQGIRQWHRVFGGESRDQLSAIQETPDGGYILSGTSRSFSDSGEDEPWLIRTDSQGNKYWEKTLTQHEYSFSGYGREVLLGPECQFHLLVHSGGAHLLTVNSLGQTVAQLFLGEHIPSTFIATRDGGYVVVGETKTSEGRTWWVRKVFLQK